MARLLCVAAVLVLLGIVPTQPASALSPVAQGWWSQAAELGAPAPLDVPPDGLHVSSSPFAYAALRFDLPDATRPRELRLLVAGSEQVAAVRLCPLLTDDFAPRQNGRSSEGPEYRCDLGAVDAVVADRVATFDVSELGRGSVLAVALVPIDVTRVSFSRPDGDALAVETIGRGTPDPVPPSPGTGPTTGMVSPPTRQPARGSAGDGPITVAAPPVPTSQDSLSPSVPTPAPRPQDFSGFATPSAQAVAAAPARLPTPRGPVARFGLGLAGAAVLGTALLVSRDRRLTDGPSSRLRFAVDERLGRGRPTVEQPSPIGGTP